MVHEYKLTGMTCSSCEAKVKAALIMVENVTDVIVSKETSSVTITMDKHVALSEFQNKLDSKYAITPLNHSELNEQAKSWFTTYKPLLLIFSYILVTTVLVQLKNEKINLMEWMGHFMAGFFLVFSFFKVLNLNGFAKSYIMYDVLAKRIKIWAYMYPFIELGLGVSYLIGFNPMLTNLITLFVMSVSIIGVLQSVLNKKQIKCACLGDVFNLPMSTITIIEDALMIAMALIMILTLL